MTNTKRISTSIIRKQFRGTFIVMTMVELANAVSCIVDGLSTSRLLGPTEMAAYGLASPYFNIVTIISGILMVSCQTMCARSMGSGKMEEANRIFSLTCTLGLLLSGLLTLCGIVFSGPLASILGARGASVELLPYTRIYLIGLFLGTPANVLMSVLVPIIQLDGDTARANLASAAVAIADILGNIIFVIVFKMGILGIGLATSLSFTAGFLVVLSHFMKKDNMFRFKLKKEDWKITPSIISAGLPRGISKLFRSMGPICMNTIVLSVGATMGMTAMSIQNNIRLIIFTPATGISSAVLLLAGIFIGEQDIKGIKSLLSISISYVIFGILALSAFVFIAAPFIANIYLPGESAVRSIVTGAIRIYAFSIPLKPLNMIVSNYLQAVGKKKATYLFSIGNEFVFPVCCTFLLSRPFGLTGVWLANAISELLLLVLFAACAFLRKNTTAKGIDKLLFLPNDFGVPDEDNISITVRNMNEVIGLSVQVGDFCKLHGVDTRRAYLSSLCIEEMAGNTVEYGFADGKSHTIDIRVIIRGDDILLRLRDDCMRFNLKEQVACWTLNPEHPEENIGIRMILGLAKDVSYTNTLKMNNLLITV